MGLMGQKRTPRTKRTGGKSRTPISPMSPMKKRAMQYWCPKWGIPLRGSGKLDKLDKLKVKAVKQNNNMLNDSPKCRSGLIIEK